jgi:hypothetical protein
MIISKNKKQNLELAKPNMNVVRSQCTLYITLKRINGISQSYLAQPLCPRTGQTRWNGGALWQKQNAGCERVEDHFVLQTRMYDAFKVPQTVVFFPRQHQGHIPNAEQRD